MMISAKRNAPQAPNNSMQPTALRATADAERQATCRIDHWRTIRNDGTMHFEIIGELNAMETIATGSGIRELGRLRKLHGRGRWRKRKGIARVRLAGGDSLLRSCTGTRQTASGSVSSRSTVFSDI